MRFLYKSKQKARRLICRKEKHPAELNLKKRERERESKIVYRRKINKRITGCKLCRKGYPYTTSFINSPLNIYTRYNIKAQRRLLLIHQDRGRKERERERERGDSSLI